MKRILTTAKPLLGKLVKWAVWIFLILLFAVIIMYIAGSYQRVSDDYQLALVRASLILSLMVIISSIYGLILDLFYAVKKKRIMYLIGILGYILIIAFGTIIALAAAFIIGAVGGNLG